MFTQLLLLKPGVKKYYLLEIEFWSGHKSYKNMYHSAWSDEEVATQYNTKEKVQKAFDNYNKPYYLSDSYGRPMSTLKIVTRYGILDEKEYRLVPIKHKINQNI